MRIQTILYIKGTRTVPVAALFAALNAVSSVNFNHSHIMTSWNFNLKSKHSSVATSERGQLVSLDIVGVHALLAARQSKHHRDCVCFLLLCQNMNCNNNREMKEI